MRSRKIGGLLAASLAITMLAACSSGADGATGEPQAESGDAGGVVTLDMWAWGTSTPELVKAWNAEHPNIQVKLSDAGGNVDASAKLLTATRAGNAPDLALVEYQTIPAMVVGDVATDITKYVTPETKAAYTDGTWSLTTFDGAIYGIPQDVGPQAFIYNAKRFKELGIKVPATWAEFKTAAKQVREKDPETYIATFSPSEFGNFAALAQQAGAQWWNVKDGKWTVGIDSEKSVAVADYWQDLIDNDLVKVTALLTPEWNAELNEGKILSWPSAMWAPGVIYGVAPDMAGDWEMAPTPQWTAGDPKVAFQGGSGVIVTTNSEHPKEAAEVAAWINSSDKGNEAQLIQGQYPAALSGQKAGEDNEPPLLMPQQKDYFKKAAQIAANTVDSITWGPNVNVAQSAFQDAMAKAVETKGNLADALHQTQQAVVNDMKTTGFEVAGS